MLNAVRIRAKGTNHHRSVGPEIAEAIEVTHAAIEVTVVKRADLTRWRVCIGT